MTILVSLIIFVCILLILVVLAQNSKGGGLASSFGGSGASQMIGVKRTSDLLEKVTWGLAIVLLVLSMGTTLLDREVASGPLSPNAERAGQEVVIPTDPGLGSESTAPLEVEATDSAQ